MELIDVLPDDVQPGDYMCINDELTKIVAVDPDVFMIDIDGDKYLVQKDLRRIGIKYKREVDEHPHGLIPDEDQTVIRMDGGIFVKCGDEWGFPAADDFFSVVEMQRFVDKHGFEVLWPKPPIKNTTGIVEQVTAIHRPGRWYTEPCDHEADCDCIECDENLEYYNPEKFRLVCLECSGDIGCQEASSHIVSYPCRTVQALGGDLDGRALPAA